MAPSVFLSPSLDIVDVYEVWYYTHVSPNVHITFYSILGLSVWLKVLTLFNIDFSLFHLVVMSPY